MSGTGQWVGGLGKALCAVRRPAARSWGQLLDWCYPGKCAVCRSACPGERMLCDGCEAKLTNLVARRCCDRCGVTLAAGAACAQCVGKGLRPYDRVVRLGPYAGPLRHLVHVLKYQGRWTLGEQLADRAWQQESVRKVLAIADFIVPVPLHWRRQIARGYNQAHVIACQLSRLSGVGLVQAVKRCRNTPMQTRVHSRTAREKNLRDAFRVTKPEWLRNKRVVVVDDVTTTGSTLRAIGRVIREADPGAISAVVLAVASKRSHGAAVDVVLDQLAP